MGSLAFYAVATGVTKKLVILWTGLRNMEMCGPFQVNGFKFVLI